MALQINKKLETGFEVTYLKVNKDINLSYSNKNAVVSIELYKDEESRREGLKPAAKVDLVIKEEVYNTKVGVKANLQEIKSLLPLEKQIKFVEQPIYKQEKVIEKHKVTNEKGVVEEIEVERFVQTKEVIDKENVQVNLSDEELLEAAKDLIVNHNIIEKIDYFAEFITYFEQGKYIDGVYNYLKTNPTISENLGNFIDLK